MPLQKSKIIPGKNQWSRRDTDALFITYQEGNNKPATKDTIARWLVSVIKHAYEAQSFPYPLKTTNDETGQPTV